MDIRGIEIAHAIEPIYGKGAQLVATGEHASDWRVRVGQNMHHVDFNRIVALLHGPRFRAVAMGAGRGDWRAIDFDSGQHEILPVVIVASELSRNVDGVRAAIDNLLGNLRITQAWYGHQLNGKSFRFVQGAIVIWSSASANEWDLWAKTTSIPDVIVPNPANPTHVIPNPADQFPAEDNRELLLRRMEGTVGNAFGRRIDTNGTILCVAPYIGRGMAASGAGAINRWHFSAQPPSMTEYNGENFAAKDRARTDAIYSVGHELGHAFGLPHPDTRPDPKDPQSGYSIMGNPTNFFDKAILLNVEKSELMRSPFIR
ncbi:hypothetical protein [Lysobacter hankyongensis]|uniref:Peptidase M10 metallopeptidase domain-containing protein n=1 Tax=Lysobacter hankyongensis TaxID=1176535 RepID=A0ABP9BXP7_9GAMM